MARRTATARPAPRGSSGDSTTSYGNTTTPVQNLAASTSDVPVANSDLRSRDEHRVSFPPRGADAVRHGAWIGHDASPRPRRRSCARVRLPASARRASRSTASSIPAATRRITTSSTASTRATAIKPPTQSAGNGSDECDRALRGAGPHAGRDVSCPPRRHEQLRRDLRRRSGGRRCCRTPTR